MKTITLGLLLFSFAASTFALDKAELDNRIRNLTSRFEAMQLKSENSIPADNLRKAHGVILLERTKAGFVFAYQGGSGVALVKDPKTEKWSPTAFLAANEASLGFQVGGQQSFVVILLMSTNATRMLTEPNFEFGGEARGTVGKSSTGEEGKVTSHDEPVLVYVDRKGLYGGAAIKGDAIAPDNEANRVYYEQPLTMKDILFDKKAKPTEAALALAKKLTEHSKLVAKK
jgi:lipid-binding SYLF domain-containing protein